MVPSVSALPRRQEICVSVVSHGQGALVDRLLADIDALPPGTVSQVIVVVDLPDDPWLPRQRSAPPTCPVLLIRNAASQGFAANQNQAFARCRAPLFAVVNPDIRIGVDPFAALVARLASVADCALVVPVQLDGSGLRESFARSVPTPWSVVLRRFLRSAERGAAPVPQAQWVAGAFMLWRSDAFRALGGFDERFRLYCEDVDICLRLQLGGGRFEVVESASVVHAAQRASATSTGLLRVHLRSLLRLWLSPVFWRYLLKRPALRGATP
jgi:N-acetylglucosaminyl-diphospho-decaprenol L-rhamnosyltransferase